MTFDINQILRPNLLDLQLFNDMREDAPKDLILMDANENALGSPTPEAFNRYPDPYQLALKRTIASLKHVEPNMIALGNGSDELIDLIMRAVCVPRQDKMIIMPPTFGMYEVYAKLNDIGIIKVPLNARFYPETKDVLAALTPTTKLLFICTPNNPTGNTMPANSITELVEGFTQGLVIIDEAYIDFVPEQSFLPKLTGYPHVIVLQTLSKAWGLAGLRLGMAFAHPSIIEVINKIKPPYNVNTATLNLVQTALTNSTFVQSSVTALIEQRNTLFKALQQHPTVEQVYPSDANFLLVKFRNARLLYEYLLANNILVRERINLFGCEGCLRITVGTPPENQRLLQVLESFTVPALS